MENVILEILEEIKTKQAEQSKQLTKLSKPNELPPEPQTVNHVHRLELKTSMWLIVTAGLLLFLIGSTVLNYNQHQAIRSIEVNDLKYRYIKMKGEATPDRISELENLFEINRDNTKIKQLRKDVEEYERAVKEKAALDEQNRRRQQEAEKLNDKAKILKEK